MNPVGSVLCFTVLLSLLIRPPLIPFVCVWLVDDVAGSVSTSAPSSFESAELVYGLVSDWFV